MPSNSGSASFLSFLTAGQQTLLGCVLLGAAIFLFYSPVVHNGFIDYDDDHYITENAHIKAGLSWTTAEWAFTTYDEANWTPLSWLSLALDYQLFGLKAAGHHAVSVALHAANAVLLFLLLQGVTGFRWRSWMVAAWFALHPVNVESVAWAAERKNVLSMLFFLLALHAYTWYTRKPGLGRYAAVFFLFALGLLSKSQVITFPLLLLLWDHWPLGRISFGGAPAGEGSDGSSHSFSFLSVSSQGRLKGWLLLEKLPLLLLSAASAVITMRAETLGGAVNFEYSPLLKAETAVIAYARYLGKALWPTRLVAPYPHPTALYPVWLVGAVMAGLVGITALVLYARERKYLAVGWFWFLGAMAPMLGLVQVGPQAMADRFAYIPYIGLFLMLTWLVAEWVAVQKIKPAWIVVPGVCYWLVLGSLTYRQVGYWRDIPTFWTHTLRFSEGNYVAENNLGSYLFRQGKRDEGAAHFRAALGIRPDNMIANLNLAAYEDSRGNFPAAIERYQMVAQHSQETVKRAGAYGSLGFIYRQTGQAAVAKQCFEASLQLAPERVRPMIGLGLLAQENGDWAEAVRQYSRASAVRSTDVGYFLLAQALRHEGRADEAEAATARIGNLAEARETAADFLATGATGGDRSRK